MSSDTPAVVHTTPVWVFVLVFTFLGIVLICPFVCLIVYLWRRGKCAWLRNRACGRWLIDRCGWMPILFCGSAQATWDCQEKLCRIQEEASVQKDRAVGWDVSPLTSCPICLERFCESISSGFTVGELRPTLQLPCGHKFDASCLQAFTQRFSASGRPPHRRRLSSAPLRDYMETNPADASLYSTVYSARNGSVCIPLTNTNPLERLDSSVTSGVTNGVPTMPTGSAPYCPICEKVTFPREQIDGCEAPPRSPYIVDTKFRLTRLKEMYPWLIRARDVINWSACDASSGSSDGTGQWTVRTGCCQRFRGILEWFCQK